ncbi:yippee-like protein [Artemisia annua]|uniref:Yippee-like protein n=1 Tax=Artemisia annua TaxID=35608 RepID=A0A2U1M1A4_ARTAN|nr:yippee-like protein [Artemisia annua]
MDQNSARIVDNMKQNGGRKLERNLRDDKGNTTDYKNEKIENVIIPFHSIMTKRPGIGKRNICSYLGLESVNVTVGVKEDRMMISGLHTVADIFCVKCGSNVGWTYG